MRDYIGWNLIEVIGDLISNRVDFRVSNDTIKISSTITTEDADGDDEYRLLFNSKMKCVGQFYRDDEYGDFSEEYDKLWRTLTDE